MVLCKYAIEDGFEFKYSKNDKGRVTGECRVHYTYKVGLVVCARVGTAN